jgi:phospholipid/cholesterol/gamma-HCH transport system substrate-binding protein
MNLLGAPEFKVGLLVLIVAGIIAGMSLSVSSDTSYLSSHKDAWFYLEDASGLVEKSGVRMAGIQIGIIKKIRLENGQARVEMSLEGDAPVTKSARIEIRPNGILGDKHVEVVAGDPRDPPLRSGEQFLVVDDRASMDRLINEVAKITKNLTVVAENIKSATEGDTDKPIGRIVKNVETITNNLAEFTSGQKDNVAAILDNLRDTTDTINDMVNDETDEGLKSTLKRSMARVDNAMKNIDEVTTKINSGKGTIGKLINDDRTVEELNTAIAGVNGYLDAGAKLQSSLDFHSNYLMTDHAAKTFLNVQLQPGLDRYYEIGVVSDAQGVTQNTTTTTDANGTVSTVREQKRFENQIKFNALFAKNFYNFTVKGGVIENTGGLGVDYFMLKRALRLSVEAFDFANVNVRAQARYSIFSGLYVNAGGENLASQGPRSSNAFVGAGLFLTNDDLKLLVAKLPF